MLAVVLSVGVVGAVAAFVYVFRERLGARGLGPAALRTAGLGALLLLLFNPGRAVPVPERAPTVLLDASLSLGTAGGKWRAAMDTALALAGAAGLVTRFGDRVAPFDTTTPSDGRSRLAEALRVAQARDRPVIVVTDGEVEDVDLVADPLLEGVSFVLLPRDTLRNAAVLALDAPARAHVEDSVVLTASIGLWGGEAETAGRLEAFAGNRRLASTDVVLPFAPSVARRRIVLRPGVLRPGTHVLRTRVTVAGDVEPDDDQRFAVVTVAEQPAVVVLVDPADWEGRFLVATLSEVMPSAVRGYARVRQDRWLDMRTQAPVDMAVLNAAVDAAALVVTRGGEGPTEAILRRRHAVWRWPAGSAGRAAFFQGDWYLSGPVAASPIAGELARVEWDSLPPLLGVVPVVAGRNEWVALSARQGRRGAERPVLVGSDSAGFRSLTTAGAGLWRWSLRGGAAREGYRTLIAAGSEWLLGAAGRRRRLLLTSSTVVARGEPVVFRWSGDSIPDSLVVSFARDEAEDEGWAVLRFDGEGVALYRTPPGVYRWSMTPGTAARGIVVVENYSPEFAPRSVWAPESRAAGARKQAERYAREHWWLFVVAILAFTGEWAWRYRRGLP